MRLAAELCPDQLGELKHSGPDLLATIGVGVLLRLLLRGRGVEGKGEKKEGRGDCPLFI